MALSQQFRDSASVFCADQGVTNELITALSQIADVTPGTVSAGDAVVVDSNKDISGFRNIGLSGNLTFSAAADVVVAANTAATLEVSDGTTKLLAFDSRNTVTGVAALTVIPSPLTLATSADALTNTALSVPARTITLTGTATVTSMLGVGARFMAPTFTDASAGTLSLASNIHIEAVAAAGGSLTLTAARMISTSVADCYLTNAGVWTDTSSTAAIKDDIRDASSKEIGGILDSIKPRSWKYKPEVVGNDHDRQRFGIVAQELPECFMVPGEHKAGGLSGSVLGSFSLAALADLHKRLSKLESRK